MTAKAGEAGAYSVWATAWGPMGGLIGPGGLRRIVLPHYQARDLEEMLAWEHPGAARDDGPFQQVVALCREYFRGQRVDFAAIPCELPAGTTLAGQVLRACRQVPYGRTTTYGELARRIGRPDSARAVAAALSRNPVPLIVPCHRVTYADGRLGGFSAPGGVELKRRMLDLERAAVDPQSAILSPQSPG